VFFAAAASVFHFRYHILKRREAQFHGTTRMPIDAAAILDWELDTPFHIARPATIGHCYDRHTCCVRRYQLIVAQKSQLRLSPEVSTAFASRSADHPHSKWILPAETARP